MKYAGDAELDKRHEVKQALRACYNAELDKRHEACPRTNTYFITLKLGFKLLLEVDEKR